MQSGFGPRWTNGEDDLHLNGDIRSLVEDLDVKLRVQDTKIKKPGQSTEKIARRLEKGSLCLPHGWTAPTGCWTTRRLGHTGVH